VARKPSGWWLVVRGVSGRGQFGGGCHQNSVLVMVAGCPFKEGTRESGWAIIHNPTH